MKKLNHLCVYMLLVVCLSSCSSKPKDAKECVMQFLECLKDGNIEKGKDLCIDYVMKTNVSTFLTAQKYDPHWELEKVVLSDGGKKVIGNDTIEIVNARYNNKDVSFYVRLDYKDKKKYVIYDFEGFLTINPSIKSYNGTIVNRGNNCKDMHFLLYSGIEQITKVVDCVNSFNERRVSDRMRVILYPNAESFENYFIVDSICPKIKNVTINLDDSWYLKNYMVQCTNGKTFYLDGGYSYDDNGFSYKIINSKGVYDFEKKILDLMTEYNYYSYKPDVPKTDVGAVKAAETAEKKIKECIAEEKERAFQKSRVEYYRKVGLAIEEIKMVRGKDKDGDPTKGVDIQIFNPTNKTIKYIIINAAALNAVNDVISRKRCRGIGPIEPRESASYSFDDLFYDYNNIIDDLSVSIELQYTDGSRKTVKWKDAMISGAFNKSWWYSY